MNEKDRKALVEETKALIDEVEAGQPEHAAWLAIQDRVQRLHAEVGSNRKVGKLIGKGETWVRDVLKWDARDRARPFGGAEKNAKRYEQQARKVLTDPAKRKAAIEEIAKADPEAIAEIAKDAIEAASDEDAREVANAALDRDIDASATKRKTRKKAKKVVNEVENPDDPNERERERFDRRVAIVNRALRDLFHEANETEWTDEDEEKLLERLASTEYLIDRVKLAITNVENVDWDEALAQLTAD
jgi:hypothetical protein